MMKKIFALVFVLLLGKMWGYSQGYPLVQNLGSDSTIVVSKGATQSRFVNIVFTDTTAANNQRIKSYPGAQIATNGGGIKLWLRNQTATAWIPINTGSGNNIYTIDGTLTGNRTLTGGGYPLTFTGLDKFVVSADSIRFTTGALNLLLNTDSASLSKKISYDGNYHSDYKQFTLVDKGYVDSVVSSSPAGTVTSIATNNATGITGGTITSTGTLAIDTTNVIATKASVTAGLAGKLNISDTAAMLNPYLRAIDTTSLSNRINLKLNISDTASMLNNYLNNVGYGLSKAGQIVSADSATLSNYYLRRKDSLTATNPLGYVTKQILADTAAAIRSSDLGGTVTSVATNNGTGITGGTITTSGTLAIDTLLISTRAWRQKGVDSVAALVGAGYVPYVGATDTLDMGQFGIKTKYLELDTSTRAVAARTLQWSNDNGTLAFGMTNGGTIEQDIGLQQFARVRNVQGSQINKGQVVYLYGASGDRAAVKLADNRNDSTSSKTLGIAVENIANGGEGFVGTFGTMSGLNLSTYTPGDILYLDSIPGGLTATKPQAPYHLVFIGVVERANSGNGLLFTNPQNGYELEELHNVRITKPVRNNAILVYDSTASLWVDTTISQAGLAVTNIATNASTGILGGPITTTGTISADTLLLSTRLWRQKGIDSVQANLTAGLALKVNISDTASMLTPYLRKVDTTAMLANYVNAAGYGLSKAGQVLSADSATLSNYYLRRKDSLTATNFLGYVTRTILADTASAIRSADAGGTVTSVATNNGTGITGGTITSAGTLAIDTVVISTRAWRQKGIDSVQGNLTAGLALKLNISDTSSMLSPYLRKVDTASLSNRINLKLNISDTSTMLGNYVNNVGYGLDKAGQVVSVDTLEMSTRAWRQKGIDSVAALINSNISGTTNYIPKFTSSSAIGNSVMQESSSNIGVGGSPSGTYGKLSVFGGISIKDDNNAKLEIGRYSSGASNSYIKLGANSNSLRITDNADQYDILTLTNAGNLGLGVTPSAWISSFKAFQILNQASIAAEADLLAASVNGYYDGQWKYIANGVATNYYQNNGQHVWRTAASGTAGNAITFTQAMTLNASGELLVGYTADQGAYKLQVDGAALFGGDITISKSSPTMQLNAPTGTASEYRWANGVGTTHWSAYTITGGGNSQSTWNLYSLGKTGGAGEVLTVTTTGAATFSSSVTAGTFVRATGGTGASSGKGVEIGYESGDFGTIISYDRTAASFKRLSLNDNLHITSGGNVGIGTSSPTSLLTVNGDLSLQGSVTRNINFYDNSNTNINAQIQYDQIASNSGQLFFGTNNAGTFSTKMTITNTGNVGIGTTTPLSILHILGQSGTTGLPSLLLYGEAPANGQRYGFNVSSDQLDVSALGANARIAFFTGGNASSITERMRITSGGNVGINTTTPTTYSLAGSHVENYGGSNYAFIHNNTLTVKAFLATDEGNLRTTLFTYSNHPLVFGTNNSERMRITSGGNVGIGTTSPTTFLHILGSNTTDRGQLSIQSNNASNAAKATWYYNTTNQGEIGTTGGDFYALAVNNFAFYAGGSERMRITSGGNVLIGTTTDNSSKLRVYLGTYQDFNFKAESANQVSLRFNESTNGPRFYADASTEEFRMQQQYSSAGFLTFYTGTSERMRITSGGYVGINAQTPNSYLHVKGSLRLPIETKTATYTLTAEDYTVVFDLNGNATANLPDATTIPGRIYVIKINRTNVADTLTIDPNGAQTIDGFATYGLQCQYAVTIQSDGSNWRIISDFGAGLNCL